MKKIVRKAFYPFDDKRVDLPERHIKAYFDSCCYEFGETDTETKLMHLLYATDKGYNAVKNIKEFLKDHPYVSEDSIKGTLADFIAELRYPGMDEYSTVDRIFTSEYLTERWDLKNIFNIFILEVKKNYSYSEDGEYVEFY